MATDQRWDDRNLEGAQFGPSGKKKNGGRQPSVRLATTNLGPYSPLNVRSTTSRRRNALIGGAALALFCALYGFSFALLAPTVVFVFFVPIFFMAAVVVWALPAAERAPTQMLEALFFAFFVALVVWPNYIALALPGLPWITISRIIGLPLVSVLLVCISISYKFRQDVRAAINALPAVWKMFVAFVGLQFISIGLTQDVSLSTNKFFVTQINWTAVFFASVYVFLKPGRPTIWAALLWLMSLVVAAIGVWEHLVEHVLWADHIPSFLKINDDTVRRILTVHHRAYTSRYRTQSTFGSPLALAEYMALTLPFVLHFVGNGYRWHIRAAASITVPFLLYAVLLTDSRLGLIGCLLALLAYLLVWSTGQWRRHRHSIVWPAIVFANPAIFVAVIAATFFVGRLRSMVWGSDATTQASSQARIEQYQLGWPKILSHPWGYGIGMGGATLGWREPGGLLSIDTYYLTIVLEYGILGFLIYYGMIATTMFSAGREYFSQKTAPREMALFVPLAVSLLVFLLVKSVFSQDDNHSIVFMMIGMVVALSYRQRLAQTAA